MILSDLIFQPLLRWSEFEQVNNIFALFLKINKKMNEMLSVLAK